MYGRYTNRDYRPEPHIYRDGYGPGQYSPSGGYGNQRRGGYFDWGIGRGMKQALSADDKISSKRVITFIAFFLVAITYIGNLIFGYEMQALYFEGMIQIVFAGLGVTVGEHIFKHGYGRENRGNGRYNENPNGIDAPQIPGEEPFVSNDDIPPTPPVGPQPPVENGELGDN